MFFLPLASRLNHRDTYLEQQQTKGLETEVTDFDRIQIAKVYVCCPGWPSGGSKESSQTLSYTISPGCISSLKTENLPGRAADGVYF